MRSGVLEMVELRVMCAELDYLVVKDLENELRFYGEVGIDLTDVSVVLWVTDKRSREIRWFELTSRLRDLIGREIEIVCREKKLLFRSRRS